MSIRRTSLSAVLAAVVFGSVGCGDDLSFTATVGAEGTTLELPGGARLVIPAGALSEDTEVTASIVTNLQGAGWRGLPEFALDDPQFAIALEPHGLTFAQPATLTLPLVDGIENLIVLRASTPEDADWTGVGPVTAGATSVSLPIAGFSGYALGGVENGACPCWDAGDLVGFLEDARSEELTVETRITGETYDHNSMSAGPGDVFVSGKFGVCWVEPAVFSPGGVVNQEFVEEGSPGIGACHALLAAAAEGQLAAASEFTATGVPTDESVQIGLEGSPRTVQLTDVAGNVPGPLLPTGEFTFTLLQQPASAVCTLDPATGTAVAGMAVEVAVTCAPAACVDGDADGVDNCGPDGVLGTDDDDCDDANSRRFPGYPDGATTSWNTQCDGIDNDCDGVVPAGEELDEDGDGLFDACDPAPADACPCFGIQEAADLATLRGATCHDAANPGGDAVLRLEGVVVDHGGGLMEYATFTVVEPGPSEELLCAVGCSDENSMGGATCDGLSRPPFTTTAVTPEQGASCAAEALNNFICIDQL